MPLVNPHDAPVFETHGATFAALSSPTRGARENAIWTVTLAPGTPGRVHRVTREETFVALQGRALAEVGDERHELRAGCALVVPAGTAFALANPGPEPFRALAVLPVGGQVVLDDGAPFTPPWAA